MPKIQKLSAQEIRKIAAGQVVDRPAHVVKELIENALDAGATQISIHIQNGGNTSIRVVDNGCGMDAEDARLCFEHHATSKITKLDDMQSLHTFGFRGEALASIAAVSTIKLITRSAQAEHGLHIDKSPDQPDIVRDIAAAPGTDITVSDIFFNIPARKKFLKKDETEWRALVHIFHAFCLSHVTVHFQLFSQGTCVHNYPAVTSISDRCAQLWNIQQPLLAVHETKKDITITGALSSPHNTRYSRNFIFCFVNKRWIKNYHIVQALLRGYGNSLPPAQYPMACIDIHLDQSHIDVNVHPRKEEIQFSETRQVESVITYAVKTTLERINKPFLVPHPAFMQSPHSTEQSTTIPPRAAPYPITSFAKNNAPHYVTMNTSEHTTTHEPHNNEPLYIVNTQQTIHTQETIQTVQEFIILGVYQKTYILCEREEGVWVVDQHAAHERVLYEKYMQQEQKTSISLLFPEIITVSEQDYATLMHHQKLCEQFGIIFEPFGHQQIIIQATPIHTKTVHWPSCIALLLECFKQDHGVHPQEYVQAVQHKVCALLACKAAVKAGDTISDQQVQQLLTDLGACKDSISCPHGRPTSWLLSLSELQKKFRR